MKTVADFILMARKALDESDRDFRRAEGKMHDNIKRLKKDHPIGSTVKDTIGRTGTVTGHDYPVVHTTFGAVHHTKIMFDMEAWEKSGKKPSSTARTKK